MDFDAVLAQVLELLQRQGRVSYRALKLRFGIDDDYIAGLKDELIYAQQVARDEDNRVLVWIGKAEEIVSPSLQTPQQPTIQETQSTTEPPPTEPRPREAERRQLTVMFCDLVDSTKLSSQLDPEDYREVVRAYQSACTEVIQRYDGHIAQYLGDGLLVYFGYPVAHEEDAQRAVYAGLGILDALKALNTRLQREKDVQLAIRLGIHTGLVVVGEMGGAGRQEQLALGETPNIVARLQAIADPNTVLMSADTQRLVQGYFDCASLGDRDLRGVAQPLAIYRVLGDRGIQNRLDVASTRGLTPLVGREQEVGLLIERWEPAKDGQGQGILLSGEAGIGKSRLVQVLKEHVANEPHIRWECRSSPYYQNTALYPLIDLLQRALQWHQDDAPEQKLEKLEYLLSQYRLSLEETIPLFAPLLSLPIPDDKYPPLNLSPQRQRQKTLESIVAILLELAEQQPVLFILEDLHWTDPTTLEFLGLFVEQVPTAAIYTLLTCRPEFQPSWSHRSYLTEITVNRLFRDQIERMATQVAGGKTLPAEVLQQIIEKTDGVPLFVEEMTKTVLESGHLKETAGHYELTGDIRTLTIPATLQDSLMARLDRLVTAKAVAQYAAVIGRQFSYELLQAVSQLDETMLQHELGRLVEAELLYERGFPPQATYTFKHALIQDTAYESLLRSTRQGYHQRIAAVMAEQFPETAENQPELLAHHYTEAGLPEQATSYWHKAGERAIQRSAHVEAIAHLQRGLALLQTLPETCERCEQELTVLTTLGPAFMATKGYTSPEVETTYRRAHALCQQVEDSPQFFAVQRGLWSYYSVRGESQTALALAQQCLGMAQRGDEALLVVEAHMMLGATLMRRGELTSALTHLHHGIGLYDAQPQRFPPFVQDAGVGCRCYAARTLWYLGYPDQARTRSHEAFALAQHMAHVSRLLRESQAVQEQAEAAVTSATEQGFRFVEAGGAMLRGWALMQHGNAAEGRAHIRQGLAQWRGDRVGGNLSLWFDLLAEAYGIVGQGQEGLQVVDDALARVEEHGVFGAALCRLKGELLLQQSPDNHDEAETCFHQAIAIAQHQQAKSWELRAATSLAKLWQRQGKREEAYDLLAPAYGWFTEGFDTADLKDAKVLLDELAEEIPHEA